MREDSCMRQLTAILHKGDPDEGGFWATCLDVPGANGQGETEQECLQNLAEAVRLLLEVGREEALKGDPRARPPIHRYPGFGAPALKILTRTPRRSYWWYDRSQDRGESTDRAGFDRATRGAATTSRQRERVYNIGAGRESEARTSRRSAAGDARGDRRRFDLGRDPGR